MASRSVSAMRRIPAALAVLVLLAAALAGLPGCGHSTAAAQPTPGTSGIDGANTPAPPRVDYPQCRFAVISDTHLYDMSMGGTAPEFQRYISGSGRLLVQSQGLLEIAVGDILKSDAQFVLVPGDMTKDGERQDHQLFAEEMARLRDKGIKVYVVPGNHDILNPKAVSYNGKRSPVPSVTAKEFAEIYGDCGYGDALYRDSGSLSYVAEPVNGLWLLCLDTCRYYDNAASGRMVVGGQLTQNEDSWVESILQKANSMGKAVIAVMHHGVVEHWKGEKLGSPDYLVNDFQHVSQMLASHGVRLAFTGHYHAQDIAEASEANGQFIFDVETGSLICYRCPIRFCSIDASQNFVYRTVNLADEAYPGKRFDGMDFKAYAALSARNYFVNKENQSLQVAGVNQKDAAVIAGYLADAFLAFCAGDEDLSKRQTPNSAVFQPFSLAVYNARRYIVNSLWNDPSVKADNNGSLSLAGK